MEWFEDQRWKDRSPHIKLETGVMPMQKLISGSRLVVSSYDSTTILECLALNIPIVCFWNGGLNHLIPRAKPYYELLRNVGILADTPEQAAELVVLHWEDMGSWWESEKVQDARKEFCEQYARTEKNPIWKLKGILTSV
jgi:putative transferase (TIGR04331 family)